MANEPPHSKAKPQAELHLAGSIGAGGFHEISRHLVVRREVVDSNVLSGVAKGRGIADGAIAGELEPAIQAVE